MIGLLFVGLALAQQPDMVPVDSSGDEPQPMEDVQPVEDASPAEPPVPEEQPPPLTREETWAQLGAEGLFRQALALQDEGRRAAALERFAWLDEHHPSAAVTFQIGKTLELDEDYVGALSAYDEVLGMSADAEILHNAAFRRVIVLEDLGRHKESILQIKALNEAGTWQADEAASLLLCRGIAELANGRHRRGIRRIEEGLASLAGSQAQTWMQARARAALTDHLLEEAAQLSLTGNKKAARHLSQRNDLMMAAEQQVIAIAMLAESEYILAGLLQLGDAYLLLHDDLLATTPPRSLDEVQQAIYAETIAEKAAVLRRKAFVYYGKGVELADQVGWQGHLRDDLMERLNQQ